MKTIPVEGFSPIPWENPQDIESVNDAAEESGSGVFTTVVLPLLLALVLLVVVIRDAGFTFPPKPNGDGSDRWNVSLLSGPEAKRLMRYHGVNGLYMTGLKAYIKRGGRWICVFHDPPTAKELHIVRRVESPPPERTVALVGEPFPTY